MPDTLYLVSANLNFPVRNVSSYFAPLPSLTASRLYDDLPSFYF